MSLRPFTPFQPFGGVVVSGFSDSFNRADGDPSTPWTRVHLSGRALPSIISNRITFPADGDFFFAADTGGLVMKPAPSGNFRISIKTITTNNKSRPLMIRQSLDPGSQMICTCDGLTNGTVSALWRDAYNGVAKWTGGTPAASWVGVVHSLDYIAGTVILRDNNGNAIYSKSISWIPVFVGMAGVNGAAFDDFKEVNL